MLSIYKVGCGGCGKTIGEYSSEKGKPEGPMGFCSDACSDEYYKKNPRPMMVNQSEELVKAMVAAGANEKLARLIVYQNRA